MSMDMLSMDMLSMSGHMLSMSDHMLSMSMDMMMASSSMMMASATGDSMDGMSSMSGDMNNMSGMGDMSSSMSMMMYFTTDYTNIPVLFKNLVADNGGEAFGIFLLLIVLGLLARTIEFIRTYLEAKVWHNSNYIEGEDRNQIGLRFSSPGSMEKGDSDPVSSNSIQSTSLSTSSAMFRNIIRLTCYVLTEIFSFLLMLAAMSYSVLYFFAVVIGLSIGRFTFDRLSDKFHIRPLVSELHH